MPYPDLLADGERLEGTFAPFELIGGEGPISHDQRLTAQAVKQFEVCMVVQTGNGAGNIAKWDGTAGLATHIALQPIEENRIGPFAIAGVFNHQALIWPEFVTTLAARKLAFDGTMLSVRQIL